MGVRGRLKQPTGDADDGAPRVDLRQTGRVSYDLVFWTDHRADRPDPGVVFQALQNGQSVDDLGAFGTTAVLLALSAYFPGFEPPAESTGSTFWEAIDSSSVFEFSWSP